MSTIVNLLAIWFVLALIGVLLMMLGVIKPFIPDDDE